MLITMKYDGGLYDGSISFLDDSQKDSLTKEQKMAANHYEITSNGMEGQFFVAGNPYAGKRTGAPRWKYEVTRKVEGEDETTVYLRCTGTFV